MYSCFDRKGLIGTISTLLIIVTHTLSLTDPDNSIIEAEEENSNLRQVSANLTFRGDYYRASIHTHKKVVVCYVGTWAAYRTPKELASYDIDNIEPGLCTHLIYSFAGLDNLTLTIKPLDPWLDQKFESQGGGRDWFTRFNSLKSHHTHLKVLLAIGGWNEGSTTYSRMAANQQSRANFVTSVVDMLRKYGFDGFDLDWEFPTERGGIPEDKHHFTLLVQDLRNSFDKYGLMLTSAFSPNISISQKGYELSILGGLLDHVHLMAYDYFGAWDKKTGHNSPLYGPSAVASTVDYYLQQGVPREKLIVGLPFYGRTFLVDNTGLDGGKSIGVGTPAARSFQGPFTKEDGFMGWNEICRELHTSRGQWTMSYDSDAHALFMQNGNKWVSFDGPDSMREKVQYISEKGLGGAMIWSIDTDDFKGLCGSVKNPLLRTINYEFHRSKDLSETTTTKKPVRPNVIAADGSTIVPVCWLVMTTLLLAEFLRS